MIIIQLSFNGFIHFLLCMNHHRHIITILVVICLWQERKGGEHVRVCALRLYMRHHHFAGHFHLHKFESTKLFHNFESVVVNICETAISNDHEHHVNGKSKNNVTQISHIYMFSYLPCLWPFCAYFSTVWRID